MHRNGFIHRVPGVYLTWANPVFLAFFSFNRINNLRVFSVAFSSIPTAPTTFCQINTLGDDACSNSNICSN